MAHPDDAEFSCAGTVASYTVAGSRVEYVLATSGNRGSHEPGMTTERLAAIREAEQLAAADVLGVSEVTFLHHNDGEVEPTLALRRELALVLRKGRPDIVLTFDPWQHYQVHPDHRAIGQSTLDAIADARMPMYYPEQINGDVRDHRVSDVYFFSTEHPNHWVDITETIDKKIAALACHISQIGYEIADVLYYLLALSSKLGIDISQTFLEKMDQTEQRVPVYLAGRPAGKLSRMIAS